MILDIVGVMLSLSFSLSSILQEALSYEASLSHHKDNKVGEKEKSSPDKFTASLAKKVGDVIHHVTSLLAPASLVAMVTQLLREGGTEAQGRALDIVSRKLEPGRRHFSHQQVKTHSIDQKFLT